MAVRKQRVAIEIAADLSLDDTAATETLGVVARKGRGKTFLGGKIVEGLHRINCPTTVIDPAGNWWGLTLAANGRDPGLPFVVLGGQHGDLELPPSGGRQLADLVVERSMNVVLDVSGFGDKDMSRFVAEFLERFRINSQKRRQARMVVFEEAQLLAPQQMSGAMLPMLRAVERIVRLGRNYGVGSMLISQRPQSVNKEVLSQVECLFVGQLVDAHARKAVRDWISDKDVDVKAQLDELPRLERGEFFCWSPSWLRLFRKVKILPKWTFDASRTPVLGDEALSAEPRSERVTSAELAALKAALARAAGQRAGGEEHEADDVLLREVEQAKDEAEAEVARLRGELEEQRQTLRQVYEQYERLGSLLGMLEKPDGTSSPRARPARNERPAREKIERRPPERASRSKAPDAAREEERGGGSTAGGTLSPVDKCQRAIMTVLIQQKRALSMKQLGMMAVYAPSSGGFKNAISKLRKRGWLEGRGNVAATSKGTTEFAAEFGPVQRLPSGEKLFEFWLQHRRVDKCGRAVLTALKENGGGPFSLAELAQMTQPPYAASSGGFKNTMSKLRTLGLIEGRGEVALAPELAAKRT